MRSFQGKIKIKLSGIKDKSIKLMKLEVLSVINQMKYRKTNLIDYMWWCEKCWEEMRLSGT